MIKVMKALAKYFATMAWEGTKAGIYVGGIFLALIPVLAVILWLIDKLGIVDLSEDEAE